MNRTKGGRTVAVAAVHAHVVTLLAFVCSVDEQFPVEALRVPSCHNGALAFRFLVSGGATFLVPTRHCKGAVAAAEVDFRYDYGCR